MIGKIKIMNKFKKTDSDNKFNVDSLKTYQFVSVNGDLPNFIIKRIS
jgi:hypothetical protein